MTRSLLITLALLQWLHASSSHAAAESYYRLKQVIVPEFVTNPQERGYDSNKQATLRLGAKAEWIKPNEVFRFRKKLGWPNYSLTVDLVQGTIKAIADHNKFKDITYNWDMTFTVPPRTIRPGKTFELSASVEGSVFMDHYGQPHPPLRPCFLSDVRLKLDSASGLGNPVLNQPQPWTWPKVQPDSSGHWSGTARFHVDPPDRQNEDNPFFISVGVPNGTVSMSNVIFLYDAVVDDAGASSKRAQPLAQRNNSDSAANDGGVRGSSTTDGKPVKNIEVIMERGARHGTPSGRIAGNDTGIPAPDNGADRPSASGIILEANRVRVRPNETVRLQIYLRNATDIANMNFDALFDGSVARPIGKAIQGGLISGMRFENNPAEPDRVRVGFAATTGATGTGSVAYIEFKAYGRPGDRTPVTFNITTVNQPDGSIPNVTPIPGEILIVGDDGFIPGDADGSGEIDERDAGDALKMSVGLIPIDLRADIDRDGQVTSRDATLIMQTSRR